MKSWILPAVALSASLAVLPGCDTTAANRDPAKIDPRPAYAVEYATNRISPAVVRLDIVKDNFVQGQTRTERSQGSGVIIDPEGHVLTNFHVAGRAKRIDITLANQEHVRATLIGSDHWTDLALVQLDLAEVKRKHMTFVPGVLGNSDDVRLGQPVLAVGTPFGLTRTVTMGIVSNTDRFFDESNIDGYETGWFNNWIQMDAAINPGNSGGPLVNLRGEVIGINTRGVAIGNNLGFAIPINTAKQVVKELLASKKVERSYTGVVLQPMQDLEQHYEIAGDKGAMVASVEKDSPAAIAGLKAEDILLSVNGESTNVRFPEQLAHTRKLMADYPVGSDIHVTVRRSGITEPLTLTVKTEKLESVITEEKSLPVWGLTVRNLTRAYLREARLPYMQGILVTGARAGSPADAATLRNGDIIQKVGGKVVTNYEDLEKAVTAWSFSRKPIDVTIRRDRSELTQVIKPSE